MKIAFLAVLGIAIAFLWENLGHVGIVEGDDVDGISFTVQWYAGTHGGRLPSSWQDIIDSGLAERSEECADTVTLGFVPGQLNKAGGHTVTNIRKYKLAFGARPEEITISDSEVLGPSGEPMLLIAPVGRSWVGKSLYQEYSMRIAQTMKTVAAAEKVE